MEKVILVCFFLSSEPYRYFEKSSSSTFIVGIADMEDFEKQALTEHLTDLRSCLINTLIAAFIGFAVSYYFVRDIGYWFLKPLFDVLPDQSSLIFTSYQEGFFFT